MTTRMFPVASTYESPWSVSASRTDAVRYLAATTGTSVALVVTLAMIGIMASFARAEPVAAAALHARPPHRLVRLLWAPLPPLPAC